MKEDLTKPRVMIDGFNLSLEKGTGVATYARNLSYRLHGLGYDVGVLYGGRVGRSAEAISKEVSFFDTEPARQPKWVRGLMGVKNDLVHPFGYTASNVPITGTVVYDTYKSRLPYFDSIWNVDDIFHRTNRAFHVWPRMVGVRFAQPPELMHWTYPLPLQVSGAKNIYTMHDLVPLRLPFTTLDDKKRYLQLCGLITRTADHIVTVSEASRTDIINLLGVDPERVTNTYQAVSIPVKYRDKSVDVVGREVEGSFGLTYKGYFLFFGSIEPKKNLGRLIEAYLSSNVQTPLVIVGARAWKSEQDLRLLNDDIIKSMIKVGDETRVKRRIMQLEYVPFALLVSLIRGAKATLFPSLYEGFGLPILESMLLGTPVMSSNVSSIPEVAADAAILIDPYDTHAISEAILCLDTDESVRDELSAKGAVRAAMFDEQQYERRLGILYSKLLSESAPPAPSNEASHAS